MSFIGLEAPATGERRLLHHATTVKILMVMVAWSLQVLLEFVLPWPMNKFEVEIKVVPLVLFFCETQ
jgi:hypothetical protein